jgi:hypothetical protein
LGRNEHAQGRPQRRVRHLPADNCSPLMIAVRQSVIVIVANGRPLILTYRFSYLDLSSDRYFYMRLGRPAQTQK